jgi:hypothetical protein
MNGGNVRQWYRMFKDGRTNEQMFTMNSEVVGWSSVVSDDLVESDDQKICERQRFTISELLFEFPQISRSILYEINTVRLGCHKFCAR